MVGLAARSWSSEGTDGYEGMRAGMQLVYPRDLLVERHGSMSLKSSWLHASHSEQRSVTVRSRRPTCMS